MKKLIVITSPYFFKGEDCILSHLFDEGMQHLHLRKPDSEANELRKLLDRIPDIYYPKVVLHDCFNLAVEYGSSKVKRCFGTSCGYACTA